MNADGTVDATSSLGIVTADLRKPAGTVGIYCFTGLPAGTVNAIATVGVDVAVARPGPPAPRPDE